MQAMVRDRAGDKFTRVIVKPDDQNIRYGGHHLDGVRIEVCDNAGNLARVKTATGDKTESIYIADRTQYTDGIVEKLQSANEFAAEYERTNVIGDALEGAQDLKESFERA